MLIVPLAPLLVITALLVRRLLGTPVLFRQRRPGLHGKPFTIYKFRTMTDARDQDGNLLSDEERCPPFGRFLRSSSLDELPELWNVLRGEMSFVGPRPLMMEYLDRYSPEQARRHDVLPGITGWAQVNGRNAISWEEKFNLDVWYVDNHNLYLDLKILWLTAAKVIKRDGISAPGELTAPEFMGSKEKSP
jgi:lipopolysaccharide/colanic/teichoic acid biosynthesis glycosyltransferase